MPDERDRSFDEIEALANEFDRSQEPEASPRTDGPVRASDVPATDYSDRRRYRIGVSNVDLSLGPLRPRGFTVIGARTGIGKTSLLEQAALANSTEHRVMLATLEQMSDEIRDSLLARLMGIPLDRAEREIEAKSEDWATAAAELAERNLLIWRPAPKRPHTVRTMIEIALKNQIDILMIDWARYIQGWEPGTKANDICAEISQAVKETALHVILAAQLKPEAHGHRPNLTMFEDSGRVGQEADKVLLLYRPFLEDHKLDNVAEIIIGKNRRGKLRRCHVHWSGQMRSFYTMSEDEEAEAACCKPKPRKTRGKPPDDDPSEDDLDASKLF